MPPRLGRPLGRRDILRATVGIAAGVGLTGLASPARAGTGGDQFAYPYPCPFPFPEPDPVVHLPPVPGMLGDRRANEVWYQLDQKTLYEPVPGILDAYREIAAYASPQKGGEAGVLLAWLAMSKQPGYPRNFAAWCEPIRAPLAFISSLMLGNFDQYYGRRSPNLTRAWAYFGQGVLYDPRRPASDRVHEMDGYPPFGYPIIHSYARAFMALGLGPGHWRELMPLNAFACALALIAKPSSSQVSPPLPDRVVRQEAWATLPLGPRQLDAYFQAFPYPPNLGGAIAAARPRILGG